MEFTSTRNNSLSVPFSKAVIDCIPEDGGVFVPSSIDDLRRWVNFIDEDTSFTSIAGSLTSALMHEEFSPIICETISTKAFPVSPVVSQLDDNLFFMDLYHGFTGYHRDYGVSYLVSYLEYTLQLSGGSAIILDYSNGSLGALMNQLLKGKKNIKAVLVSKKGVIRGIDEESLVWNGGNIYPIEMEGTEAEIRADISKVFSDREFVKAKNLTVANTTNVCRLLSQLFFFPYSFAQIKNKIDGDIYYSMDAGNYGTLVAGLYSWRFALPVNGFLIPSTPALARSPSGNPVLLDSMVNINNRSEINPTLPANLERLEAFFGQNELMMRNFVFPIDISERQREKAAKELFMKYGVFADRSTANAYAAIKEAREYDLDEDCSVVLTAFNDPCLDAEYCRHVLGEAPEMPENIKKTMRPVEINRPLLKSAEDLRKVIESL
jgi:threonine synthase